jgi:hypothetical protein
VSTSRRNALPNELRVVILQQGDRWPFQRVHPYGLTTQFLQKNNWYFNAPEEKSDVVYMTINDVYKTKIDALETRNSPINGKCKLQ